MAFSKKGLRKITVNKLVYFWTASGNDGYIHLFISPVLMPKFKINATFDYHSKVYGATQTSSGETVLHLKQQLIITPYIVRQVIIYALNNGWNDSKNAIMNLGTMDDKVDLRITPSIQ